MKVKLFISLAMICSMALFAQKERRYVREGNEHYEQGFFEDAAAEYDKALLKNPEMSEAEYNLGTALFRQEKFEDAARTFEHIANQTDNPDLKASAFHNQGNSLLANQDLEGAIEAYKNALRTDPNREDSRYNLAWSQKMLKQQQEQEQNQENQENQEDQQNKEKQENEDEKKDGEGEQDEQNQEGDEEGDKGDQKDGNGDSEEEKENEGESKPNEGEEGEGSEQEKEGSAIQMSQEEMERLLQSLMREEQNTQDKVNRKKMKGNKVKTDKDW